jgi:hypothetical protein
LEPQASPAMSVSSDDETDLIKLDGEYDSVRDADVDMPLQDDVDTPDSFDLHGDVVMERDSEAEEDEE